MSTEITAASNKVPKSHRGRRVVASRSAKLVEGPKRAIFIQGAKTSEIVTSVLKDVYKMKHPDSKMMTKRNEIKPFEDASTIEFLSRSNDASLFLFASHSKKRPHNIVAGRTFDNTVLDAFEFGIDHNTAKNMQYFQATRRAVCRFGGKPLILFQGELFESNNDLLLFKNFVTDFFRGEVLEKINLASLDRIIICTALTEGKVLFRHYGVVLTKSKDKFPHVELDEIGPRMDLTFRRRKSAPDEIRSQALKVPKAAKIGKKKNIVKGKLGDTMGRVHLGHQNFDKMATRKFQGLKRRRGDGADDEIGQMPAADAVNANKSSRANESSSSSSNDKNENDVDVE